MYNKQRIYNVQIQTNSSCNGNCIICPYKYSWQKENPGIMSMELFSKIINNLKNFRVGKLCLYLQNEPLLDPLLFDRIKVLKNSRLNFQTLEISTNLSVLDHNMLYRIHNMLPDMPHDIWISFHGISKESYEEIMGLNFDITLNNIRSLLDILQKRYLNILIRGSGTPRLGTNGVFFDRKDYYDFWSSTFNNWGITKAPRLEFYTYHDRAGNSKDINFNFRNRSIDRNPCIRFTNWMHFLYDGEPILCCMDYNKETGFCVSTKHRTIEYLYSSNKFEEMYKNRNNENFICNRCVSPGG